MHDRSIELFIIDIFLAVEGIIRETELITTSDELISNQLVFGYTCSQCMIIGEAMNHVLDHSDLRPFVDPEWRIIVDFRNVVAHGYFGMGEAEFFEIVKHDVPKLEEQMIDFIKRLPEKWIQLFLCSIEDVKIVLARKKHFDDIKYLESLAEKFSK